MNITTGVDPTKIRGSATSATPPEIVLGPIAGFLPTSVAVIESSSNGIQDLLVSTNSKIYKVRSLKICSTNVGQFEYPGNIIR